MKPKQPGVLKSAVHRIAFGPLALLFACSQPLRFQAAEQTNAPAQLQNVHRLVFLGDSITYSGQAMLAIHPRGREILKLVQEKQRMMKDAWLTETGHERPGMNKGLPLAEAQAKAAELDKQIHQLVATVPSP